MVDEMTDKEKQAMVFGIHDSDDKTAFDAWTKQTAILSATAQGIELNDNHWQVINFLRIHYQNVGGDMLHAHELTKTLEERFADEGGLKYLYKLFPGGPLNQGCRIAGVPVPADAKDASFGSIS